MTDLVFFDQSFYLGDLFLVLDILVDDGQWNHMPEILILNQLQGLGLMKHIILHHLLRQVVPCASDSVMASSLTDIDLKHLECAIPVVIFQVTVRKTFIADVL